MEDHALKPSEPLQIHHLMGAPEQVSINTFIRKGVPLKALDTLRERTGIDAVELGIINPRTLRHRRANKAGLTREEGDHLFRIEKLYLTAREVFGDDGKTMRWLRKPLKALDGQPPLNAIDTTPGYTEALEALERIRHGIFA